MKTYDHLGELGGLVLGVWVVEHRRLVVVALHHFLHHPRPPNNVTT